MLPSCIAERLLGLPTPFRFLRMEQPDSLLSPLLLFLVSEASKVVCPKCQRPSAHAHSRYWRTLRDLPCGGRPVIIRVELRRFFCRHPDCPRRIFTEPIPDLARKSARRTERMRTVLEGIGHTCGGRVGVRQAEQLGMPVSRKTLLGYVRVAPLPPNETPRVLGVDDWAIKKGFSYGTLLYDLERRRVVDLLPDRSAESFARWLKEHPGVEAISRDRGGCYAQGSAEGAPHARQIADRWHLLSNASEALIRLLIRHHTRMKEAANSVSVKERVKEPALPVVQTPSVLSSPTKAERESALRREGRKARYERVHQLFEQGLSLREVARITGHSRITVRRYVRSDGFPELASRSILTHPLDRFSDDLVRYREEGGQSAAQVWRDLQNQGYEGSYSSLRRYLKRVWGLSPRECRRKEPRPPKQAVPGPRSTAWMLLQRKELEPNPREFVERLCEISPEVKSARDLIVAFFERVRHRQWALLDWWLRAAEESGLAEIRTFAKGVKQDYAAVVSALTYEWSNGPVEGAVNRLKSIKRAMYGRANFDLLRARVLQST